MPSISGVLLGTSMSLLLCQFQDYKPNIKDALGRETTRRREKQVWALESRVLFSGLCFLVEAVALKSSLLFWVEFFCFPVGSVGVRFINGLRLLQERLRLDIGNQSLLPKSSQALAAQGSGGVIVSRGVQETWRCGYEAYG